ncbi:MAG: hypothetical protein JJE04_13680 [Acidobacteriia bacterium]|nr:hypothetical protein [Terriglobia bacterium]
MLKKINLTASILAACNFFLFAQGPPPGRGPDPEVGLHPDTVYFTLSDNQTTQSRTIQVKQKGPAGPPLTATIVVAAISGGNWLAAGNLSSDKLTLTATKGSLTPGQYESTVTVTPPGEPPLVLKAFLRVVGASGGQGGGLLVRPGSLSFHMTLGGANPEPKFLNVSIPGAGPGGGTPSWSASRSVNTPPGGNWFQITTNAAGGLITVTPNGAGLGVGKYNGTVTVTSGSQSAQSSVTLEVKAQGGGQGQGQGRDARLLVIHPSAFNFIRHPGDPVPSPKTLSIKTTRSTQLNWTAMSTANWLAVTASGSTPGTAQLTLVPANLPPTGHHEAMVKVTSGSVTETARVFYRVVGTPGSSSSNQPTVPVTTPSAVTITPASIEFSSTGGVVAPSAAPVQLSSNTSGISFTATRTTGSGGPWLTLSSSAGTVPGGFNVTANPAGLAPGMYTGLITLNLGGPVTEQRNINVVLRVIASGSNTGGPGETPRLTLSRGGVTFQTTRNAPTPPSQQVALEARGAATIPFQTVLSIANGLTWLTVTPTSTTAPTNVTLNVNATGLAAGVYAATVFFQATGTTPALSTVLNVVLTITNAAAAAEVSPPATHGGIHGLFIEPAQDFFGFAGGVTPVTVRLFNPDGSAVIGARVLLTTSGEDPSLELNDLGQGVYAGTLLNISTGPVSLVASATTGDGDPFQISTGGDVDGSTEPLPAIFQDGIVSTASFASGVTPTAPGSILSIFGRDLAESSATASSFPLPGALAGVRVLVGGLEAPLLSVIADAGDGFDQINFQLPVEAAAFSFADVVVLRGDLYSNPAGLSIGANVPSIFTQSAQGSGEAAALHPNFTVVTSSNPASPGATVLLYATGLGETAPDFRSGLPSSTLSRATADVQVLVAGVAAKVTFAGMAPGFAGLYQINFEIPSGIPTGEDTLQLITGGIGSGEGVTISVGR